MTRPPRRAQRDPRCDAVTAVMRAIESVPPGARWRVSWAVDVGDRIKRSASFLFTDAAARKRCTFQGLPFTGDHEPTVAPRAAAPITGVTSVAPSAGERSLVLDRRADVRSRVAGDN